MPEQVKITPEMPSVPTEGAAIEAAPTPETEPRPSEKAANESSAPVSVSATVTPTVAPVIQSADAQRMADIERILEEDLSEIYFKLPKADRAKFRQTGEEAAREINTLLSATTVKVKKIIDVIRGWLKLIPGVNRFFLDKEAKIKADRLLRLNDQR